MIAVIMAGGKGTRLRSVTGDAIPKPLAPVAGKPILQWQIECLREQGVRDIVLIVGYLGEKICDYFGDGAGFGARIRYIRESVPLGTAGALSLLPPLLEEDAFFLLFGDVLFDVDLARMARFHEKTGAEVTLFAHPNSHPYDSDLVLCGEDGRVRAFSSKHDRREGWYHNLVNAGLYRVNAGVCRRVPEGVKTDLEKGLLRGMFDAGEAVYAYRSPEYVKDVGTPERIAQACREIESGVVRAKNLCRPQKAIFLDRDGTVNKKNGLVYREDQLELEDGAAEAIRAINRSGYLAILATNQPVVARGLCSMEDVGRIHMKLETLLGREGAYLDGIRFCPHHPDKGYPEENPAYKIPCLCRKPGTGMLEDCAEAFHIDLAASWMVGDTTIDIQTGKNAGMRTALVRTGDGGRDGKYDAPPDIVCDDLLQAVHEILAREGSV